ncbi:MAG: O-antigen ligase family protein, partial [Bacteroidota bacterium]
KTTLQRFVQSPAFLAVTGIFFICLLSGLYSEDMAYFWGRIRIKLPFLILPFAFVGLPRLRQSHYHLLLLFFFYLIAFICIGLTANYFWHYDYFTQLYKEGKIMTTPIQHIRFSLLVCVAIAIGGYLHVKKCTLRWAWERGLRIGLTVFLTVFLHLLAVRSGLLALYTLFLIYLIYFIFYYRRYWLAAGLLVGGVGLAVLAVQTIPTLQNKVGYMRYSVDLFLKNENIRDLSDSRRLGSIQAGVDIGRQHFWIGTGLGDILHDTNAYLEEHYPAIANLGLLPHNQLVFVFASTGFVGLLLFMLCTLLPFFYNKAYTDLLFCSVQGIYFSSFLVEHTVETQIGTASYLFFWLLTLKNLPAAAKNDGP